MTPVSSAGAAASGHGWRSALDRLRSALPGWLKRYQLVGFAAGLATGLVAALLPPLLLGRDSGIEPGELVIMMDRDQSVDRQRIGLIEQWDELQAGVTVRIIEVSSSATAARSQLVAHAQSGAGGVDIYSLDVTWVAEFAQQGWLQPLTRSTIDEGGFLAKPLDAGRYDGTLWALPFNTDAPLLYYRTDVFDQPPATWEQLAQGWDRHRRDGGPAQAAYAGQFADYEGLAVNFLEAVLAQDPGALEGQRWTEGGDAWVAALAMLAGGFSPEAGLILPESLAHTETDSREAFRNSEVLFMRNWPLAYRLLTDPDLVPDGEPGQLVTPDQVGVTTLPRAGATGAPGVGVLGGQSLAIASSSARPNAAQHLIEFLTSPRSQEKLFVDGGFVPTQKVVYEDLAGEYAYLAAVREAVEQARPRPVHPRYELISETIRRVVRPYLEAAARGDPQLADPASLARQLADALEDARDGFRR